MFLFTQTRAQAGRAYLSNLRRGNGRAFATTITETPIVIVGGGPTGLMLSNLLSSYGTPSVLLEARPAEQIFQHPQAHFLNTRTMEILRYSLPKVYDEVLNQMPPVDRWKYFQWGRSMTSPGIARVVHPVDRPLQSYTDANGLLLPLDSNGNHQKGQDKKSIGDPASTCSVGHLAQHHFSRILYDAANQNLHPESQLNYGVRATNITTTINETTFPLTIETDQDSDKCYRAKIVVAADGSQSPLRKLWQINMNGQTNMQNLVNIHVKTSPELSKKIYSNNNSAMLHFVYNEDVVAVIVCHTEGEIVLQVPYFPPYQTMERDFSPEQVRHLVEATLGVSDTTEEELKVESIRSWEMSSLVATKYKSGDRCALAGDAAHVFPPAGGFGMNTGLQDVHNMAWRLSLLLKGSKSKSNNSSDNENQYISKSLQMYEEERRPVAQRNAALSVRNYNRTLRLAKACYLNDQHPSVVIALLSSPPLSFLPLEARQDMFRRLVKTAMWPLKFLEEKTNPHGQHMRSNVRDILSRREGLPLVFPKFELGFGYPNDSTAENNPHEVENWEEDAAGYSPKVQVGYLIPHIVMEIVSTGVESLVDLYPYLKPLDAISSTNLQLLTTTDLPSQLRNDSPCFVVLLLNPDDDTTNKFNHAASLVWNQLGIKLNVVGVCSALQQAYAQTSSKLSLILHDKHSTLRSLTQNNKVAILLRPDGVVLRLLENNKSDAETTLCRKLCLEIQRAIGKD